MILDHRKGEIALCAFETYRNKGRGVVFLERSGQTEDILEDQVDMSYVVYDPGRPDPKTARMIDVYDPNWEIVFQYMRMDGLVRTAAIRTAPGRRHPWRIWLFERLMQAEEQEQ